jgi:hypothetical protein
MRALLACFAALLAGTASAEVPGAAENVYHIAPAEGWVRDGKSGLAQGYAAVFYPKGGSWKESPAVIYTTAQKREGKVPLLDFIDRELAPLRARGLDVTRESPIQARDGKQAEVCFLSGGDYPNHEAIAYFEEETVFVLVVLSAKTQAAFSDALQPFTEVVSSYKFLSGNLAAPKR